MGTGVGEAMLVGAAVGATAGGAGAAIQGGDPLQGALLGGAMGGVGGGLGAGFGASAGATSGATSGAVPAATSTSVVPGAMAGAAPVGTAAAVPGSIGFGATGGVNTGIGSIYAGAGQGVGTATNLGSAITSGSFGAAAPPGAGIASGLYGAPGGALPVGYGAGAGGVGAGAVNPGNFTGFAPQLSNTALGLTAAGGFLGGAMQAERDQFGTPPNEEYDGPLSKLKYDPDKFKASNPTYAPDSVYRPTYAAEGGIMRAYQSGGPVELMSTMNTPMNPQGGLYPQGMTTSTRYDTPTQRPVSAELMQNAPVRGNPEPMMMASGGIARYAPGGMTDSTMGSQGIDALAGNRKRILTKEQMDAVALQGMSKQALNDIYGEMAVKGLAKGGPAGNKDMAAIDDYVAAAQSGGMSSVMAKAQAGDYNAMIALNKIKKTPNQNYAKGGHLGGYSDGGRMLKGPGDGMSDNIPASIGGKQPARLADGEFVVPADVVSHLGNGSTDAGAKQLYAMMNRVRKARTGNPKQGKQIKPAKYLTA